MRRKICGMMVATTVTVGLVLACAGLVCASDSIIINNSSFETPVLDTEYEEYMSPYTPTGWDFTSTSSGGTGVVVKDASWDFLTFWDNANADQNQVGYVQNLGYLSQSLTGLQAGKQYWLQYFYNAHELDNWARGRQYTEPLVDMFASFNGTSLSTVSVHPVEDLFTFNHEFFCATVPFTPTSSTGTVGIGVSSVVDDGNSLVIDGVSVIQRDANEVVIKNPSFEASGITNWLIVNMIGWDSHWTMAGVCHNGEAFADNGTPDGQDVAFMQGQNSKISQTITGLQAGKLYMLSYYYNIRAGTVYGGLKVTLGSTVVQDSPSLTAVGGTNPYYRNTYFFVSDGTDQTLTFMETRAGDCTCVVDNVSIKRVDYDTSASSMADLQSVSDGQVVRLTSPQVVTAVFSDGTYYVEDINRIAGIKVVGSGVKVGDRVDLVATVCTDSTTSERYLQVQAYNKTSGDPLKPLAMTNKSLGGAHTGYQPGITTAGLNNIGLLVKIWGKVTSVASDMSYFYVNDGSNVNDGTNNVGIRVDCSNAILSRVASIFVDEAVAVTGVVGLSKDGSTLIPVVHPKSTTLDIANTVVNKVTVTSSDTSWISQVNPGDTATTGSVTFANAPDPLFGSGSALISMGSDGSGVVNLRTDNHKDILLSDITELSICNYMTSFTNGGKGIGVRMSVKLDDIQDNNPPYTGYVDDVITCEPLYNDYTYALCELNKWVTFDALNAGRWWSARHLDGSDETTGVYKKLSDYIAAVYPQVPTIAPVPNGGFRVFIGGSYPYWNNVVGYVDNVQFGTKDGTTVYDFEP